MKNYISAVADFSNPIQNRNNQRHTNTSTRGRKQASESTPLDSIEIRATKTKKSNRTSFLVSKSVSVSRLMNEQRRIAQTKSLRVCGTRGFRHTGEGIKFEKHSDGSVRTSGVFVCKSACCVSCSSYKARLVFERINPVVESVRNKVFITLTTNKIHDLSKLNKAQKKALKATIKGVKRYFKKYYNQSFGYVRSRETTFDLDNHRGLHFHPHFHLLFLNNDTDFDFVSFESKFREVWRDRAEKNGLTLSDSAQKFIKVDTTPDKLNKYLIKGLSHELSGGTKKDSKKGESLFTLLAESSLGNKKAEQIYKTYSKEFAGDKAIQTDNGFKELEERLKFESESEPEAEPEEETKVERVIHCGELSYEKLFKRYTDDFEDIIRFNLINASKRVFESFADIVSEETQSEILRGLGDEDRAEEDFQYILFGLFDEWLHKHQIDLKSLERRTLNYSRELTLIE